MVAPSRKSLAQVSDYISFMLLSSRLPVLFKGKKTV